jgi:hypothetical protein
MKIPAFEALGHNFAVKVLDKLPGYFQPRRYSFFCVRCRWSFLVNDGRRGVITALDADGDPMDGDEAAERIATFAQGPCPALKILSVVPRRSEQANGARQTSADNQPAKLQERQGIRVAWSK